MSMSNLAYARCAYKSFSRSARHLLQLIAGHQSLQTGWASSLLSVLSEDRASPPDGSCNWSHFWKLTRR